MHPLAPRQTGGNIKPRTNSVRKLLVTVAIACAGYFALLTLKPHTVNAPGTPSLRPAAAWTTHTAGWVMPMPEQVRGLGIAANDIRYLQNGKHVDVYFHELAIEKHPALKEARLVALAMRIAPRAGPAQQPQPIEGILSERKPVIQRTNISLRAEGAVECLKTGSCEFWLELTLQEPGGNPYVERSRRVHMPLRPTV